jgi:dipeptidyl aminopeptidase/acylaminoacyl peptidase
VTAAPSGIIAYEVTGKGIFAVSAAGEQLGLAGHQHTFIRAPRDDASSPDGNAIATVERRPDGVFLNVIWNHRVLAPIQLAGPDAPTLVDGGKSLAAAVKGVPLVLAWAPDSKTLAYGSITGEPYVLHLLTAAGVRDVQVSGGYVGELTWSPDGRYLAISTYALDRKDHSVLIIGVGETVARRLSDGCHIVWSPDSRYIAIHRDPRTETGAWVLSADASERYAITTDPDAFPLTWTGS